MRNQGPHSTPPSYGSHFAKNSRRGRIKRRKINSDRPVVAQEHSQPNHAQQRDRVEEEEAHSGTRHQAPSPRCRPLDSP